MILIEKKLDIKNNLYNKIDSINRNTTLFIDIETLGFSVKYHMIYLVGLIYLKDKELMFRQWFAEKDEDEYQLLYELAKFLNAYTNIIHYNGLNFDMPFIKGRMSLYQIKNNIDELIQHDIYIDLKPYGNYMNLPNLKLKSVEKFFGIHREDQFTGGQLISVYKNYQANPNKATLETLLLHNKDDLIALFHCMYSYDIINYFKHLSTLDSRHIKDVLINKDYMIIDMDIQADFELKINLPYFKIFINHHMLSITIPIINDELKLFIDDYENYFYLTREDYAVHKSIGKFVDHKYRKRAKKSNCYTKKRGAFLPLPSNPHDEDELFYKQFNSKPPYLQINDQFLKENGRLESYVIELLKEL